MIHWRRNRPTVGYPPYVCQPVLVFRSNLFGSMTHRGGRDARVPVRRRFAANLCGITRASLSHTWYNKAQYHGLSTTISISVVFF
ncbi:MAG: hypothetical protein LBQ66_04240 [Planctomycetaceae bacterium]|nr:hypothetical protein [Planctomycetaceae bacterium]